MPRNPAWAYDELVLALDVYVRVPRARIDKGDPALGELSEILRTLPLHPDRPTILTFYVPFERPGPSLKEQAVAARTELLATSYRDYERKIREQLVRLFARGGFDPRNDIAGIILNRWGHAYVCPAPGFYFGRSGKPAAPDVLREPVGRITFANAELHGHQNWADATAEGKRAVEQLIKLA